MFQIPQTAAVAVDNPLKDVGFSLFDAKIVVFLVYCISVGFCFGALTLQFLWVILKNSVTRLGDLLHFGKLFKACGNNYFGRIAHIFRQFL